MAQLTITIPNDKLSLILDAYADTFNYQPTINGQPNPQTKVDFAKSKLIEEIKAIVKSYKIRTDSNAVITNANNESDSLGLS